ncbi:hypothetical protein HQ36_04745 [Porphyromonas gingivicanis]|uniref:HTH luxR-type domain-containing protein n=1 Tax=Porphyromonas gingivicanis TaxID=266762 RepID=A0A0A2GCP2_9PORP|nr:LuxR C-terminal-related transcriptional regulator [Porphyromonas gingivicanis]KGN98214.1 hypothetical protein HQ36_04745 [Porphyromonas gingivicanis]
MLQSVYKLLIVEPNPFIRLGIEAILKRNNRFRVQLTNTMDVESLSTTINFFSPDIILANPIIFGFHAEGQWKSTHRSKLVALCVNGMYSGYLTGYDAVLSIEEQPEAFVQQILSTIALPEEEELDSEDERLLSPREKDVVAFVAKGLTNKEIASKLSISIHTVITHRRNIAKKLKIHSPSGLTIYAIVNKLVNIDEIQA